MELPGISLGDFVAPDVGDGRTPYACSFHWLRIGEGRAVGLDVIRSDDTDQLGLRVFEVGPATLRALVHVAPKAEWAPFAVETPPNLDGPNVVGRGRNWIAGHVKRAGDPADPSTIREVRFSLVAAPESTGLGPGRLGLEVVRLSVMDWLRVRTSGWLEIDGERFVVDGFGPMSLHFGEALPDYAYLTTLPGEDEARPQLLLSSVHGDDLRFRGDLLGDNTVTYAEGKHGVPALSLHVGRFTCAIDAARPAQVTLDLGGGRRLELDAVQAFPHRLLGRATTTATAEARFVEPHPGLAPSDWGREKRTELGRVVLDFRGDYFASALPK